MNKNVTLAVFEGNIEKHQDTEIVYNKMKSLFPWTHSVYITENYSYNEALKFELGRLLDYIHNDTTHVLFCTWDGFIINPGSWDDNWLEYDMIGAPWPQYFVTNMGFKNRVGNTGFSLQSRKFLNMAYMYKDHYTEGSPGDWFLCSEMYENFTQNGIKYGTLSDAAKFSWELDIEEDINGSKETSFGFHGWRNYRDKNVYYSTYLN